MYMSKDQSEEWMGHNHFHVEWFQLETPGLFCSLGGFAMIAKWARYIDTCRDGTNSQPKIYNTDGWTPLKIKQ
jgi:hypothetical protein